MPPGEQKGTVTALRSIFSPEETQKAAERVHGAISDRRSELSRLHGFISDNRGLINLVQRLPDDLSPDVMVPFGGAAFFPGKLIHTNEFLVLLGGGYYAEQTAKQTVEILKRRGGYLKEKVDSLKATMLDLEREAEFFKNMATDASEGLVEIREEYIEEASKIKSESDPNSEGPSEAGNQKMPDADEEHAKIMARLDELEKEELEEEGRSSADEEQDVSSVTDEDDDSDTNFSFSPLHHVEQDVEVLQKNKLKNPMQESIQVEASKLPRGKPVGDVSQHHLEEQPPLVDSSIQYPCKEGPKNIVPLDPTENLQNVSIGDRSNSSSSVGNRVPQVRFSGSRAFTGSIIEHQDALRPKQSTRSSSDQAFTGSIIEHEDAIGPKQSTRSSSDQSSGSNPSKPVSRFKMQRGNR